MILQLYRNELADISLRLSSEQQEALIERARSGDSEAKETLIRSLLGNIFAKALCSSACDDDLAMELTSTGNHALIDCFDRLIQRDYPLARMTAYAYGEMRHYGQHCKGLITLPHGPNIFHFERCGLQEAYDLPASTNSSIRNTEALYQAMNTLPEKAQQLLVSLFGLYDQPQMSMSEITDGQNSTTKVYQTLKMRKLTALKQLREMLAPFYQPCMRKVAPDYADLELPEWCRQRLDEAAQMIQERGEQLSMNKLRKEARVHTRYASAYLYQLKVEGNTHV